MEIRKMVFLDRKKELEALKNVLTSKKAELINFYGERRLGKTSLLTEVEKILEKEEFLIFYYQFVKLPSNVLLEEIQQELRKIDTGNPLLQKSYFNDWESFFTVIMGIDNLICFFDEIPYLLDTNDAIPSILQRVWDHTHSKSTTKIVICGSFVSMMEELMDKKQPLYGRITVPMKLEPMNFVESRAFFEDTEFEKQVRVYMIFGGNPFYLDFIKDEITNDLEEILLNKVFNKYSKLTQIPVSYKTSTLKPEVYNGILHGIAKGKVTHSEIVNFVKLPSSNVTRFLDILRGLHIISREEAFLAKKRTQYLISDPFTRFWFNYLIKIPLKPKDYVKKIVLPTIDEFLSKLGFENFCKEIIIELSNQDKLTDSIHEVHTFGDEIFIDKQEEKIEIDLVAFGKDLLILGECKWTNNSPEISELRKFNKKCTMFIDIAPKKYGFKINKFKRIEFLFITREESTIQTIPKEFGHIRLISLNTIEQWLGQPNSSTKLF
jgi:AAA+ ATPase superfamily predicted ATPase